MKTGYYKLTKDLKNPLPDKRRKRVLAAADFWPAGLLLYITSEQETIAKRAAANLGPNEKAPTADEIKPLGTITFADTSRIWFDHCASQEKDSYCQGNEIISYVEPAPLTLGQIINHSDWPASFLLALLIDTGKITLADVANLQNHDLTPEFGDDQSEERDAAVAELRKRHEIK